MAKYQFIGQTGTRQRFQRLSSENGINLKTPTIRLPFRKYRDFLKTCRALVLSIFPEYAGKFILTVSSSLFSNIIGKTSYREKQTDLKSNAIITCLLSALRTDTRRNFQIKPSWGGITVFWEKKLENWVNEIRKTSPLPLRLELWTGQKYDLNPNEDPKVVIRIPELASLSYLLETHRTIWALLYVEGKIEVQGTLNDMITRAIPWLTCSTLQPRRQPSQIQTLFWRPSQPQDRRRIHWLSL